MISFKCFIINQGRQLRHNAPVPPGGRELLSWPSSARSGPATSPRPGSDPGRERSRAGRDRTGARRDRGEWVREQSGTGRDGTVRFGSVRFGLVRFSRRSPPRPAPPCPPRCRRCPRCCSSRPVSPQPLPVRPGPVKIPSNPARPSVLRSWLGACFPKEPVSPQQYRFFPVPTIRVGEFVRNQTAAPPALGPYLPRLISNGNFKSRTRFYFCLGTWNFAKYLHLLSLKVQ